MSSTMPLAGDGLAPAAERPAVAALRAEPTASVVIIGGGINGIATFRDLALQGVPVVLVERNDFVSGASAASSHMIHGGVRYLENGEFRLVQESVTERNALIKIAPHYVKPLRTTVPIFSTFSGLFSAPLRFLTHTSGKPSERGALLIKTGLTIYDAFSRDGGSVPRHRFLGAKRSRAELPALNRGVKYTATYFDASMHDPERLALDVLHDGLAAGPHARAVNSVEAVGLGADGVRVRDRETGVEFDLAADVVVNTSGPWTDLTNAELGRPTRYMGGTKGSHIVLDHPELLAATDGREIFFEHEDGRIVLIYPLKGRVMVGTTDLEHDMREPAICTEDEVDYFFDLITHVFPDIAVDRSQIVYRFSGVRPLPRHDDTQPGFVSRDYRIERADVPERPGTTLLSLVGGKWTTFRALAEHLANDVLGLLGRERVRSTAGLAIGGGAGYPMTEDARRVWVVAHGDEVGRQRAETLLERYGTRAEAIIADLEGMDDAVLTHHDGYTRGEVAWLVRHEHVAHLLDVVQRRTSLAFTGDVTMPLLDELAEIAGDELGWDGARRAAEIALTVRVLSERHGMRLAEASIAA
ncbi:glycerol-3-phosphate dehydrogenase/oxidase [Agromyces aerolatus]|uniref:glycerol-3-phosphate dehydrogenase/oxidase n=1 Tax=Agromyces sp. LY-1074 TaxID=3074080 RepID=UPI00285D2CA7|nr:MULTISPECIES: glycerol-3-phosphate dehydrogenase/oxidase [unclassified Agromyces]MDR5700313.1 glycerol-3-phosphate dehydrogenase/oxidase [Agromyces sp. LY-1074]MDR5706709.1 glycerol-3-phosphate dehydrogenase/oxidase [Agromyces sp. LY-1358]